MWVEYWIRKAHPSMEDYEILAELNQNGEWECKIELPLINKTVKSISEKEVNAMLNASYKAAKLIDGYMKEHPELEIINRFKGKRWEIISDETGKYVSTGMSSAWRREQGKQIEKMTIDSLEAIKKTIKKLNKINGSPKNLYIQVLDRSLFDDNMTVDEIVEEVNDKIRKEYHTTQCTMCCGIDGDSVIVAGYAFPPEAKGELN